ncbi:RDD family protein [Oceanobacillus luteolus]|uniref:RDD family protein n=1 Tax=Oceanobacillus luteolus TaxID=1274358 RepID=A0ABW4HVM1_9BACI|nr:RDD family protein [Oceanobacillus luteolus]MCM3740835.1 RDD family protein [Oceanobacillus luteolus]
MERNAGFWIRLGAILVDGIFLSITLGFLSYILFGVFLDDNFFLDTLNLVYFIILPFVWYGYTIGKKAFGIRIVSIHGNKLGLGQMILRELVGGIIYALTFGIGAIISAFMVGMRPDKRSIHDFIAGTYVIYEKPETYEL